MILCLWIVPTPATSRGSGLPVGVITTNTRPVIAPACTTAGNDTSNFVTVAPLARCGVTKKPSRARHGTNNSQKMRRPLRQCDFARVLGPCSKRIAQEQARFAPPQSSVLNENDPFAHAVIRLPTKQRQMDSRHTRTWQVIVPTRNAQPKPFSSAVAFADRIPAVVVRAC
jgi:hypothetical protein